MESSVVDIRHVAPWMRHLYLRWDDATSVLPLQPDAELKRDTARAVLPSDPQLQRAILASDPLATLPGHLPQPDPELRGWHRHLDLIDNVALVLMDKYGVSKSTLQCEGGYSVVGDGHLADKRYIIHRHKVLYEFAFAERASADELAKVLRLGRSFRFLGIVPGDGDSSGPFASGLFMWDVMGGDSLGMCDFEGRSI